MTAERVPLIEYVSMGWSTNFAFIMRPPSISYDSNIYYLPFNNVVWICSIVMVILCTSFIALTLRLRLLPLEDIESMTISDFFLFGIASSCQTGSQILTKILSARISMVFFFTLRTMIIFYLCDI